ncbi:MAG TPA: efflux RND transporter periplasmic adaptor subunit [Chryseosolibacter sp.]
MSKINSYLLIAGLSVVALACSTQAADNKGDSPAQSNKLPVDVKVVKYTALNQEESVAGSLLANREVEITSELLKKVEAVHFSDGSYVATGQKLYSLEQGDIRARLRQSEAELALAKLNESRLYNLLKNESVRQEEYDIALTKVQSLEATKEQLEVELSKTTIVAPFSGIAGISKVQIGSLVSPGTPLVKLQEQGRIKVQFTVSEKYVSNLKNGKAIFFTVSGNENRIPAVISATESGLDAQSRTITVHAVTSNQNGALKPGMSARVFFSISAQNAKGLGLPTESLIPGGNGYNVFVVKNGIAKMTPVTVGNRNEAEALITSGLNDGDTVMISNILRSGDGTPVQIVSSK